MRRFLFFFVLALALAFPRPSPASVVKSAYAPEGVIYAWSDALGAPGGVGPAAEARHLPDGTAVESVMWFADADCEARFPGLPGKLDNLLGELVEAGLDPELLRDLKVYLLPAYNLKISGCESAGGFHLSGTTSLALAGLWWDAERNFLHELGHLLSDRVLDTRGYSWTFANEKGREYLKVREYPTKNPTDGLSLAELPWGDRAAEWFAEDFAYWAAVRTGHCSFLERYFASCDPPGEKLLEWFDRVFLKKKTERS